MLRCARPRGSSCVKLHAAAHRANKSTTALSPILDEIDREYGLKEPHSTPDLEHTNSEGGNGPNTTVEIARGEWRPKAATKPLKLRELPLSPYMDPKVISDKERHHAPKPQPGKNLTQFQKQLAKNPYARALETPIRQCRVTLRHFPRFFLQEFVILEHPDTGEPWWVPRSLSKKAPKPGKEKTTVEESARLDGSEEAGNHDGGMKDGAGDDGIHPTNGLEMNNSTSGIQTTPGKLQPQTRGGPRSYILARQGLLAGFSGPKNDKQSNILASAFPVRLRNARQSVADVYSSAKIRKDLDIFTLELMRRRIVEELERLMKLRSYIAPCSTWDPAELSLRQTAAVLWIGHVNGEEKGVEGGEAPPEFATIDIGTLKKRKVPVYDLQKLLGDEHLQRLRNAHKLFQTGHPIIKQKNASVDLQMKLWRLQGFVAEYSEFEDTSMATEQEEESERARNQDISVPEEEEEDPMFGGGHSSKYEPTW